MMSGRPGSRVRCGLPVLPPFGDWACWVASSERPCVVGEWFLLVSRAAVDRLAWHTVETTRVELVSRAGWAPPFADGELPCAKGACFLLVLRAGTWKSPTVRDRAQ